MNAPKPTPALNSVTEIKNRDLNALLREIRTHAEYLAIFSGNAANVYSDATLKAEYIEITLQRLTALVSLNSDLLALERARLVAKMQTAKNTQSYTTLHGAIVVPECMDWLEDGHYWKCDENGGSYYHDYGMDSGDYYACSRYSIGVDENGDGISVWLNCDMQEVEV
jgi:hypothetical protein